MMPEGDWEVLLVMVINGVHFYYTVFHSGTALGKTHKQNDAQLPSARLLQFGLPMLTACQTDIMWFTKVDYMPDCYSVVYRYADCMPDC